MRQDPAAARSLYRRAALNSSSSKCNRSVSSMTFLHSVIALADTDSIRSNSGLKGPTCRRTVDNISKDTVPLATMFVFLLVISIAVTYLRRWIGVANKFTVNGKPALARAQLAMSLDNLPLPSEKG